MNNDDKIGNLVNKILTEKVMSDFHRDVEEFIQEAQILPDVVAQVQRRVADELVEESKKQIGNLETKLTHSTAQITAAAIFMERAARMGTIMGPLTIGIMVSSVAIITFSAGFIVGKGRD